MTEIYIDASNAVLGRLSTAVAKKLQAGEMVFIVNSKKAIITGNHKRIVGSYLEKRRIGSPQHGPFFPKRPDLIMRRTIRGMLPKTKRGRNALKNLHVYSDVPVELKDKKFEIIPVKEVKTDFISLGELAKSLGWSE